MTITRWLAAGLLLLAAGPALTQTVTLTDEVTVLHAVRTSAVRVEFHLRYDEGEAPRILSSVRTFGFDRDAGKRLVREERPLEMPGLKQLRDYLHGHNKRLPKVI